MSEPGNHPGDVAELCRRAEERDRGDAARWPETLDGLSPEEARRTLHELLGLGADAVLVKPVSAELLLASVADVLKSLVRAAPGNTGARPE